MKCFILLLMLVPALDAGELRSCSEEDICATIIFNQLAIASLQEDMKALMTSFNSTRESKTSIDKEELDECLERSAQLDKELDSLEEKYYEVMSKDQGKDEEAEKLLREVEELRKNQRQNEDERQRQELIIIRQRERIRNLTLMSYRPVDCVELQIQGRNTSGVYKIYPNKTDESVDVFCDMESDGGGWTVFLARMPQTEPVDFNESWVNFKKGFGNVSNEFWLGNDLIHSLTSRDTSSFRIDAENYEGERRWATWKLFSVGDENNKYQLTLESYNTSSTMGDSLSQNSGHFFTTFDVDNDESTEINCAIGTQYSNWGHGGWWYKGCGSTRPTAPLKNSENWDSSCWLNWSPGENNLVSFKMLSMKFRRNNYLELAASWTKKLDDL